MIKIKRIYTYENRNEAKELIGKKVLPADYYGTLVKLQKGREVKHHGIRTLEEIDDNVLMPFKCNHRFDDSTNVPWQFIAEIEEESLRMTNGQLAEWVPRFGLARTYKFVYGYWGYDLKLENKPVLSDVLIRPWGSDEWIEPTVDIYERDCKGGKA